MLYNKLSHETFTSVPLNKIHNMKRRKHFRGKKNQCHAFLSVGVPWSRVQETAVRGWPSPISPVGTAGPDLASQRCHLMFVPLSWLQPRAHPSQVWGAIVSVPGTSCQPMGPLCPLCQGPCPRQPPLEPGEVMTRWTEWCCHTSGGQVESEHLGWVCFPAKSP